MHMFAVKTFAALRSRHFAEELPVFYRRTLFQSACGVQGKIFRYVSVLVSEDDVVAVKRVVTDFFDSTVARRIYVFVLRCKVKRKMRRVLFQSGTPKGRLFNRKRRKF